MKTILHISKYYFPDLGGIETVVMYLAEGMKNYNNVVVCFSTDHRYHENVIRGVKVYRVPVNFSFLSQDFAFSYRKTLSRLMEEYKPEYVHVHCPNPFVYPLVLSTITPSTKLVLHWHSDILSKGMAYWFVKNLENRILHRADVIIATSPNYIEGSKPLSKYKDKVKIAQNAIIESFFAKKAGDDERISEIKARYRNKRLVLSVGRHVHYKGLEVLIQAEQYINSDVQILIGGKGPETRHLKELANNNPRITFLGRLSDDDLRCYSYAADICAFPSITKAEAFGISLAEAMYCYSVPVTFTLNGSGVNWVSLAGTTGEEVELNNVYAYAAAIDRIIKNDTLLPHYADAAHRRIAENFTTKQAILAMEDIYDTLS